MKKRKKQKPRHRKPLKTKKQLESHLVTICYILSYSKHLSRNGNNMLLSDNETHKVIKQSRFLKSIMNSLYQLSVIELSKLFSHKNSMDDYSLFKLLDDLRYRPSLVRWNTKTIKAEIRKLEYSLKEKGIAKKVKQLLVLRNKYYAHTDKKRSKKRITLFYPDLSDLVATGEGIVNKLSTMLLKKPLKFTEYNGEDVTVFFTEYLENIRLAGLYNLDKTN